MNIDYPSSAKFQQLVELKPRKAPPRGGNYKPPTKKEYVRHVRRLADHFHCDPATLCEDQVRTYFLFLRQEKKFSGSPREISEHCRNSCK